MDFKKFGIVIAMLGLLTAGYGGVQLAMNLPVEVTQSDRGGVGGFFQRVGNELDAAFENSSRQHRRGSAKKVVLAGGIIVFLGLGIMASAKDGSRPAQS
ncbi:MAG TPA: hypothetical protein VEX86_21815 [Longimicrobium sp.]|nr:hypothetical protein [Longimicrobium sp.]